MTHRAGPFRNRGRPPGVRAIPGAGRTAHTYLCADSTYVYGWRTNGECKRWLHTELDDDINGGEVLFDYTNGTTFNEAGYDAPAALTAWHITPRGNWLILLRMPETAPGTEEHYFLWRSTDDGATWTRVFRCGLYGGTHYEDYRTVSSDGLQNVVLADNTDAVIYGEYVVNDAVAATRLSTHISTDDGATWSTMWRINETADNFRHVHAVRQNPYDKRIMVFLGDGGNEAGMVAGPNTADWSAIDDTAPGSIAAVAGFDCQFGSQRYRTITVGFEAGFIHSSTDNFTPATETGFFKTPHKLDGPGVRTTQDDYFDSGAVDGACAGLQLRSGHMLMADFANGSTVPDTFRLWGSGNGEEWWHIADWEIERGSGTQLMDAMFELPDGRVVCGGNSMNGSILSNNWQTLVLQVEYPWNGTVRKICPASEADP